MRQPILQHTRCDAPGQLAGSGERGEQQLREDVQVLRVLRVLQLHLPTGRPRQRGEGGGGTGGQDPDGVTDGWPHLRLGR